MPHIPSHFQTEEQRRAAFGAAGVEPTPTPVVPTSAPTIPDQITGGDLTSQPDIDFQQPQPTPVPAFPEVPEPTPTPKEEEQSDLIGDITRLQGELVGQSAFRTAEEKRLGVQGLRQTQQDLQSRLSALKAEQEAIPLRLQQEAEGRGITKGGLAPIETARLRENAIQALSVSAMLEASRGNLTLALDQVDRAVAAKYDPIKEEIAVKKANLDLIIQDPKTSIQDKNRAQKQKDAQDAREREIEKQEKIENDILNVGVKAAQAGADAVTLREIQKLLENPTQENLIRANELAAPFLEEVDTGRTEFERAFFREFDRLPTLSEIRAEEARTKKPTLAPSEGFFDAKIESDVREDFVSLQQNWSEVPTDEERNASFNTLRNLYSPQEASDESLRNLIGVKPVEEIESQPTEERAAESWISNAITGAITGIKGFFGIREAEAEVDLSKETGKTGMPIQERLERLLPIFENTSSAWKEALRKKLLEEGYSGQAIKQLNF